MCLCNVTKPIFDKKGELSMLNIEEEKIQSARIKMQDLWEYKGFTDDEVLAASIEVDVLLNNYQNYFEQKIKMINKSNFSFKLLGKD
jgi:hypothetical protein